MQIHIGEWLTTLHSAFNPHAPGHGSLHFWLIQAKWLEHSEFVIHSGLQFGGLPIISGRHEQEAWSPTTRHWAFDPQGDGWHGSEGGDCNGCSMIGVQRMNGSPVYRDGQLHIGLWLTTWHLAFIPHVPGHGSLHFWLLHASFCGQSALLVHSGLQVGGLPIYPTTHEHTAWLLICRHWEFGPQGDGLHGFVSIGANEIITYKTNRTKERIIS